jgi:hypothetical protein
MDEWSVVLEPWIVQDGNYGDFSVGEVAQFALAFEPARVTPVVPTSRGARHLYDFVYTVAAEVIYASDELSVLDFGLRAYRTGKPEKWLASGGFVLAQVSLAVDPFDYWAFHSDIAEVPALVYSWRIDRITEDRTPTILHRILLHQWRDESKTTFREVPKTDVWGAADDVSGYILHCTKLDVAPKRAPEGRRYAWEILPGTGEA